MYVLKLTQLRDDIFHTVSGKYMYNDVIVLDVRRLREALGLPTGDIEISAEYG